MTHTFNTTPERSRIMSKVRGTDTKPELALRKALWAKGVRYRKNYKKLPGKPDIAITKHKIAVFVDGEFWHGHNWEEEKKKIKSNREYWINKIERNMERDRINELELEKMGYTVLRFWEKEVKKNLHGCVDEVLKYLRSL